MGDDGVLAVYNGGIIAALVEHAGIDAEYIAEIYGAVKGAFIGADNDSMILIDDQIILRIQQRPHELVRRRKIVKTVERGCILHPWVMGIKGDKIIHAHICQLREHICTVKGFPACPLVLAAFIKEGHDHIDSMRLSCGRGYHALQVLLIIIGRFVVRITVNGIGQTMVTYVNNDEKILSADGFPDDFPASKRGLEASTR